MDFRTMVKGTLVYCKNEDVLDPLNNVFQDQMDFEAKAKFKEGERISVTASLSELINYYKGGNTYNPVAAKKKALLLLSQKELIVLGATRYDEGTFYTIESEDIPMIFLPEAFIRKEKGLSYESPEEINFR